MAEEANREGNRELSVLAYAGYYFLLFFAYWFGAKRFDLDGDGDFDPEDVQLFLQDKGIVRRNFIKKVKQQPGQQPTNQQAGGGERPPEVARPSGAKLDSSGEGRFSFDDLAASHVQGQSVQEYIVEMQRWPVFIVVQSSLAVLLWFVGSLVRASNGEGSFLENKAGIDTISDGWSDLRLSGDECQDYRGQVWRYLTYQWTHVGISHVLMNTFMNLVLGIPLEGLHGGFRILAMYNIGVFGGACCYWVGDAHKHVVGMSGGCFALIGMHLADLVMNWPQKKFRKVTLVFLIVLALFDILSYVLALGENTVSHTAHVGGYIAGLIIGIVIGKNLVIEQHERVIRWVALFVGVVLLLFSMVWMGAHFPPQNIYESFGYCWTRQVYNPVRLDSPQWVCIHCGTQTCIDSFSAEEHNLPVRLSGCTDIRNGDTLPL